MKRTIWETVNMMSKILPLIAAPILLAHSVDEVKAQQDIWPTPLEIASSFQGLGIDVLGIDIQMTMQEAQAASSGDLDRVTRRYLTVQGIQTRDDVGTLRFANENSRQMRDEVQIRGTFWHTGNTIVQIARRVTISDTGSQPLEDAFVRAILDKYGEEGSEETSTRGGIPGMPNYFYNGFLWTVDEGRITADCGFDRLPNVINDIYRINADRLEEILADLESEGRCDGYMEVLYSTTRADTVQAYYIEVTDIRAVIADALNERRVQEQVDQTLIEQTQSGNDNAPDL